MFKTSVSKKSESHRIIQELKNIIPEARINFDLKDCDKILRIEATHFEIESIHSILHKHGYKSEILD